MDFVNRVLLLRDSPTINKFELQCQYGYHNPYRLNSWICTAIKLSVQEVLNFKLGLRVKLPRSLFTSVNLVILKLGSDVFFKFPVPVFLPRLKVLHLHSLTFLDDGSFKDLLSGCPIIEELDIDRIEQDNIRTSCIYSSTLKKMKLHTYNNAKETSFQYGVVIKAPAIENLELI
ncbi:hypothetical protein ACSBR2_026126 [Camellia fascicularis]